MRYLHTMVRVTDVEASLHFWCDLMGLEEVERKESQEGKFTLIFWPPLKTTTPSCKAAPRPWN